MPSVTFKLIRGLTRFIVFIFFGEVDIVGMENLANKGPVILVGNHKNQFVDALMVVALVHRPVSFLIAEKSMHRALIGDFARAMHCIPVVRAADQARSPSAGADARLVEFDAATNTLTGTEQCRFTQECKPSESLVIKGHGVAPLQIVTVLSDTQLVIKPPVKHEDEPDALQPAQLVLSSASVTFKILPKIDQSVMFSKTFDALAANKCVCLFPEGGSSDRTDLLPLKAGVSVMALGAAAQGTPVTVVPFGLNYNEAGAWRSRVLVDVGRPIPIPEATLADFHAGRKREAYSDFLGLVETGLRGVTLNAPDQQTLRILRCMRRMYQGDVQLDPKRFMELNRKFVLAFQRFRGHDGFLHLVEQTDGYLEELVRLEVKDAQVAAFPKPGTLSASARATVSIAVDSVVALVTSALALPAYVFFAPMLLRIRGVVRKEVKKALAGSTVKVKAHDVVASQKIMGAVIWFPITVILWTLVFLVVGAVLQYAVLPGNEHTSMLIWLLPVCFLVLIVPYCYLAIRAMDVAARCRQRLPAHWLMARSPFSSTAGRVWARRRELVLEIQEFFEFVVVPQMEEWRVDPIVHRETIVERRRPSQAKRALDISFAIRSKDLEAQVGVGGVDGADVAGFVGSGASVANVPESGGGGAGTGTENESGGGEEALRDPQRRKSVIRDVVLNMQGAVVDGAFDLAAGEDNEH